MAGITNLKVVWNLFTYTNSNLWIQSKQRKTTKCKMIFFFIMSPGTNRLVLRGGSNPCEGQLEIHHDKIWGYVGHSNWGESTEKVVCRSTQCGEPLSAVDVIRLKDKDVWLDEIKCEGKTEGQLWECDHPGFGATTYRPDQTKWMKCSGEAGLFVFTFLLW